MCHLFNIWKLNEEGGKAKRKERKLVKDTRVILNSNMSFSNHSNKVIGVAQCQQRNFAFTGEYSYELTSKMLHHNHATYRLEEDAKYQSKFAIQIVGLPPYLEITVLME